MDEINILDLIYIWCGILSGLWVVLAICLVAMCLRIKKISRLPNRRVSLFMQNPRAMSTNANSVYSYGSPAIVPGEDLARRGYSAHAPAISGKHDVFDDTVHFAEDSNRPGVTSPPPRNPTAPMSPRGRNNANFIY